MATKPRVTKPTATSTSRIQPRNATTTTNSVAPVLRKPAVPVTTGQRGLKLRPANSNNNPSILPVLCVYSDQNQLVRKEQFRQPAPPKTSRLTTAAAATKSNNNENVVVKHQQPRATLFKSTVSSLARNRNAAGTAAIADNKRTTVPRSEVAKVQQQQPKGIVENRRRNAPAASRKAEMTSGVVSATSKAPPRSSSSSTAEGPVRASVVSQSASRVEATRPCSSGPPKKTAKNTKPRTFHQADPDLKVVVVVKESQGDVDASAAAVDSSISDNYVVFDYPNDQVVEVMGTYPDGYSSSSSEKKSPDDVVADIKQQFKEDDLLDDFFKFVSNDNIRKVTVLKTAQGLGLSVSGGVASSTLAPPDFSSPANNHGDACSWPGLIRIKKIFPHGAAWQTGQLAVGDVLLAANGQPLTGCTNYEALEVLRCSPRETHLLLCRIPCETAEKMGIHPPESPTTTNSSHTNWLTPILTLSTLGEFEISMTKVNGSLGFTLRKEDESILGHYIRSLVKEPAISDGRIRPGDKIISVNGVDMSAISHAEAVAFLRRCPETVTIRLFRDSAVTPLSPLSPTEPEPGLNRPRPLLRQEAQDLLHDLAVRKQGGSRGNSPAPALSGSPCSPRRRRLTKTPSPDLATVVKDRFGSASSLKANCSVASSSTSPPMSPLPEDMERDVTTNGLDLTNPNASAFHTPAGSARLSRPDFLDLSKSLIKKQRFMFTPPNDYPPSSFEVRQAGDGQPEVPTGDQVELEISEYFTPSRMAESLLDNSRKSFSGSFCIQEESNPPMESLVEDTMDEDFVSFHSSSTLERFAPQGLSDRDLSSHFPQSEDPVTKHGKDGLVKWKGIVLTPDEDYAEEAHMGLIQTIELNKGWNSRLGFGVGQNEENQLVISAIYDESVAARDGRLKVGDHVLRVNGEKLEGCSKDYVIDILRKTRGPVAITVRKSA